jgi:branched-chain amino acid transport system substrate-binding protein
MLLRQVIGGVLMFSLQASATTAMRVLVAAISAAAIGSAALAAETGPIRIGFVTPLTGALAPGGKDALDAINLYLESVKSTIAGRKIELIPADDAGNPEVAVTKSRQLVERNNVHLLMGFLSTAVCNPVAIYAKEINFPMMATIQCGGEGTTIDPKIASPYFTRWGNAIGAQADSSAYWLYKRGFRKASIMTADYVGGAEFSDLFASVFVSLGGTIVQEQHPPLGTADFGPYLAQLSPEADVLVLFEPGADGLRFGEQYRNYISLDKIKVFDMGGQITAGSFRRQLGDKIVGIIAMSSYSLNYPNPANVEFQKAWEERYPRRGISQEAANSYAGGQILTAALTKINGQIEDKKAFIESLRTIALDTVHGPTKLDETGSAYISNYFMEIVKGPNGPIEKPLDTYEHLSLFWMRSPEQLKKFPFTTFKGKWVGMTKEKLGDVITLPK